MLPAGLGIEEGTLEVGGLFATVVVVTGTVVVGVSATVVVVAGSDVVGVTEVDGRFLTGDVVRVVDATWACRVAWRAVVTRVRRCAEVFVVVIRVEWEVALCDVATVDEVVRFVEEVTASATTGRAVALNTMPATRKPSAPTTTERRGARFETRFGSPRLFCPCVKFNMNQLSETHSKMLPTSPQHPINSVVQSTF
jgi:hypothetical protein